MSHKPPIKRTPLLLGAVTLLVVMAVGFAAMVIDVIIEAITIG